MATDPVLRDLSTQALNDYDELLRKYNRLVVDSERTSRKLIELETVAEPMYDEFGKIQTKYEFERSLRAAAESYASKVVKDNKKIVKDNKKIKRQSAMLLAQMSSAKPIAVDINIDEPTNSEENRIEELNATISELHSEIAEYKNELNKKEDEFNILSAQVDTYIAEKEEYRFKCEALEKQANSQNVTFQQQQRELRSLKRVSTLAYTDYTSLEERYETEKALRIKAEIYARQLQRKRDSLVDQKRASINTDIRPEEDGESLQKIIAENDKLHTELTEQETKYIAQIEDLQRELSESTSHSTIESLEEKLDAVKEDLQRVTEELGTQKHENSHLTATIAKMEKERTEFLNVPLPPPPPPPPGPKAGISHLVFSKKKKKEQKIKKVVGKEATNNVVMQGAIEEMMSRIKSGRGLKKVDMNSRPEDLSPDEEAGGAMKEMHKYLVDMKKKREERTPKESSASPTIDDELAKKFKDLGRRSRSNSADSAVVLKPADEPAKNIFLKQGSLDSVRAPVPRPRPRQNSAKPTTNGASSELAAKLAARFNRIPDADNAGQTPETSKTGNTDHTPETSGADHTAETGNDIPNANDSNHVPDTNESLPASKDVTTSETGNSQNGDNVDGSN